MSTGPSQSQPSSNLTDADVCTQARRIAETAVSCRAHLLRELADRLDAADAMVLALQEQSDRLRAERDWFLARLCEDTERSPVDLMRAARDALAVLGLSASWIPPSPPDPDLGLHVLDDEAV
jgi:uncharacterized protein